jgi:hypothetical protein
MIPVIRGQLSSVFLGALGVLGGSKKTAWHSFEQAAYSTLPSMITPIFFARAVSDGWK